MSLYAPIVTTLAALALLAAGGGILLAAAALLPGGRVRSARAFGGQERHLLAWGLTAATLAMAGSLYLSDVVGLQPCLFCWYQRIAMYPLVVILAVALLRGDLDVWRYGLPLAGLGLILSVYHVSLQWNPSLEVVSCQAGAPCTGRYLSVFGFVTIPTMAGSVFLLLTGVFLALRAVQGGSEWSSTAKAHGGSRVGLTE